MSEAEMNVDLGGGRQGIRRVDYPSNSKTLKAAKNKDEPAEKKPVERVVTNPVEQRQNMPKRVLKTFLVEDGNSIMQYIVMDVLIPAAKNTISDVITQALQQAFWGGRSAPGVGGRAGYTNYSRPSTTASRVEPTAPRTLSRQARATHNFSEFIVKTRVEAEDVIEMMRTMVDQYGMVSVMDLYDMLDLTGDFTDAKWGWTDLRNASVRPVRGGYLLDFPDTVPLTSTT